MSGAFVERERRRWTRGNARLWERPDAARFFRPVASRHRARIDPRYDPLGAAEQKYSPSQPRVPAGNPNGGQWTSGDSGGGGSVGFGLPGLFDELGSLGDGSGFGELDGLSSDVLGYASEGDGEGATVELPEIVVTPGSDEGRVVSDAIPDNVFLPGSQVAQNGQSSGYRVDLLEEEALGGHTIAKHVGKSEQFLLNDVREMTDTVVRRGERGDGFRSGSFPSLEAANKLINATIAQNPDAVDRVVRGEKPYEVIGASFESITGYEAYMRNERSQPIIRGTFGVGVMVIRDLSAPKGFRVLTGYPRNFDR